MPPSASRLHLADPFPVFLFDIDGVLIEPRGYRRATLETLADFSAQMGLAAVPLPDETDLAFMEAHSITNEWDMIPLALAAILESLAAHAALPNLPAEMPAALWALAAFFAAAPPPAALSLDYRTPITRLAAQAQTGEYPAQAVMRLAVSGLPDQDFPFPRLRRSPILPALVAGARSATESPLTRRFQQIVLGSEAFARAYDLPVEPGLPGALSRFDRPHLAPAWRAFLPAQAAAGNLALAAYTMRPSQPAREVSVQPHGFTPEAEMALDLLGWGDIPLIGYGRVAYYAEQAGLAAESLLKPAPFQALAALLAALTGQEAPALEQAGRLFRDHTAPLPPALTGRALALHVFEDSPGGLTAARRAAELLAARGVSLSVQLHGVAADAVKQARLAQTGAQVTADVNQALAALFPALDKTPPPAL